MAEWPTSRAPAGVQGELQRSAASAATTRPVPSAHCVPPPMHQRIMRRGTAGGIRPSWCARPPAIRPDRSRTRQSGGCLRAGDGLVCFGNSRTGASTLSVERASAAMLFPDGAFALPARHCRSPGLLPPLLRQLEPGAPERRRAPPASAPSPPRPAMGPLTAISTPKKCSRSSSSGKSASRSHARADRRPYGMQFNPGLPCQEDLYPQAPAGFPNPDRASFETVHMRPGSVLFMPRGTWRGPGGRESLSVSIIVRMPSALGVPSPPCATACCGSRAGGARCTALG